MKLLKAQYDNASPHTQGSSSEAARPSSGSFELVYIDDVIAMLGGRKSRWWVRNHFAPKARLRIGRTPAWPRSEALSWIEAQRDAR